MALVGPHAPRGTIEIATTMIRVSTVSTVELFPTIVGRVLPADVPTPVGIVAILPVMTAEPVEGTGRPEKVATCRREPFDRRQ